METDTDIFEVRMLAGSFKRFSFLFMCLLAGASLSLSSCTLNSEVMVSRDASFFRVFQASNSTISPFSCAIDLNRYVWCTGQNNFGQLGNGIETGSSEPQFYFSQVLRADNGQPLQVFNISSKSISLGATHACAIDHDQIVHCWGYNGGTNRLGRPMGGTPSALASPVLLELDAVTFSSNALRNAIQVTANSTHSCALLDSGQAYCWGESNQGQLGNLITTYSHGASLLPAHFQLGAGSIETIYSITTGVNTTCIVADLNFNYVEISKGLLCVGDGSIGQLANSLGGLTTLTEALPGKNDFGFLSNIQPDLISLGDGFGCAVTISNQVYCWGKNHAGQLGAPYDTSTTDCHLEPLSGSIAAFHYCATAMLVRSPSSESSNSLGNHPITSISARSATVCLTSDALYCWGLNDSSSWEIPTPITPFDLDDTIYFQNSTMDRTYRYISYPRSHLNYVSGGEAIRLENVGSVSLGATWLFITIVDPNTGDISNVLSFGTNSSGQRGLTYDEDSFYPNGLSLFARFKQGILF